MDIKVKIMDYRNVETVVAIEDFEHVAEIYIEVITGDEVLHVIYMDGSKKVYDSSNDRMNDYLDNWYYIYDKKEDLNLLDDPGFVNREDSYDYTGAYNSWR